MNHGMMSRAAQFWRKSSTEKVRALRYHFKTEVWNRMCPGVPLLTRLPHGEWWLARNDALSDGVFARIFDGPDIKFLECALAEGMTVIDVGGHLGFYTLLMSRRVGPGGRVVAFEPSPREFRHLETHIRINRCANVRAEQVALADHCGRMDLYLVDGPWTTRNSLRSPQMEGVQPVSVRVATLDQYLSANGPDRVDLIKLDAEGAELRILHGAAGLLSQARRPIVLCELNDPVIAECGWGHRGEDVLDFLEEKKFRWFELSEDGSPTPLLKCSTYCTDLVAVPEERLEEVVGGHRRGVASV